MLGHCRVHLSSRGDLTVWAKILVKNLTLKVLVQCSLFVAYLDRSHCPAHSPSIFFRFLQFLTDLWSFGIKYKIYVVRFRYLNQFGHYLCLTKTQN
jgi:hypothetical protein